MATMYCIATKNKIIASGYTAVKKINDTFLIPFGDFEGSFALPVDEKGHKRGGDFRDSEAFLFLIDEKIFWELGE